MKERIHLKKMGSFFCKKIAPTVLVTVGAVVTELIFRILLFFLHSKYDVFIKNLNNP